MAQAIESESMSNRTSISVTDELADELYERKQRGESYEDVIWRLIEKAEGETDE
jgi:predicted CopG family antitoxin